MTNGNDRAAQHLAATQAFFRASARVTGQQIRLEQMGFNDPDRDLEEDILEALVIISDHAAAACHKFGFRQLDS